MFAATAQYAREVIHAFNDLGSPLWTRMERGRPRRFGPHARELICRVARTPPQQHRVVGSTESVRQVLRDAGVRWQATTTWKASRDPEFTAR